MFNTIIIGAGPAGIFAAYNLIQHGITNIALLDKGSAVEKRNCPLVDKCLSCKSCFITEGIGGSGLVSDGKVVLDPRIGGELNPSQDNIDRIGKIFNALGGGILYHPTENLLLEREARQAGIELIKSNVLHLGTDNLKQFVNRLFEIYLSKVKVFTNTEIKYIQKYNGIFRVETNNQVFEAKKVILALGRNGTTSLPNILKSFSPKFTANAVDLGVRVETPNEVTKRLVEHSYDFKARLTTKTFKDKVRTFCYSSDTKVYTRSGFKLFSDISLEDEFLSVNPTTQTLEWVKAVSTQKYKFNGKMKHIKSHQIDWLVTPEHKMYVKYMTTSKERKPIQRYKFKSIDEIVDGDQVTTDCIWQGVEPETVDINGFKLLTEDYCELLGYYLSEGYSMMRKTRRQKPLTESQKFIAAKPSCLTGICQEKPNSLKKMIECVERCGIDYRIDDKRLIILKDQRLNYYLHNFGKQPTRYIPNDVKNLSPRFINIFLDAYCLGDGHIRKVRHGFNKNETYHDDITFYTSSQRMAEDLCELILKSGRRPYIYENKTKGKVFTHWNGDYESKHNMFYVSPRNNTTHTFNVIKITDQDYDDYVYDVTLEKNHTLLILRNNKIWWGSNCVCPSGEVTVENNNGLITCNGHSSHSYKTNNTNFSLLVSIPLSSPVEPIAYAENMVRLANKISTGVIIQRYADLKQGRRSTPERIKECPSTPTLNAYPGDLSLAMSFRYLTDIIEGLETLEKIAPGIASESTLLYGLEAKFYSNRIILDDDLQLVEGLYVLGDCSGRTRGIMQSAYSGLLASDKIIKGN